MTDSIGQAVDALMNDYPFIRELKSPVGRDQLRPLDPRCNVVQFGSPLSQADIERVSEFLRGYPEIPLRIYGHYSGAEDLSFLKYFTFLKGFQADVFEIKSWNGLEYLPDSIEFLAFGSTRRKFSVAFLERFRNLKDLYLDGHLKDINVLSTLKSLEFLTLRSITLPDLSPIVPLKQLKGLALKLGGTKELGMLGELLSLRYLELWMIRGLTDLTAISSLSELRYVFLQTLKNVAALPSFANLSRLERVYIEDLKELKDLSPVAEAPNLQELALASMRHLSLDDLSCFVNHPSLKAAGIGLCSVRRNAQARELLGLPEITFPKPLAEYLKD
ncbi:MAG: hypothetical protein ABL984_08795 [Pyrinomonadaceae bacterium]